MKVRVRKAGTSRAGSSLDPPVNDSLWLMKLWLSVEAFGIDCLSHRSKDEH